MKRTCCVVDLEKKREKKDKYLHLTRELRKLSNMRVMVIPIEIGTLGTDIEGFEGGMEELEIGGRIETIKATALLRSARIPRRVLGT